MQLVNPPNQHFEYCDGSLCVIAFSWRSSSCCRWSLSRSREKWPLRHRHSSRLEPHHRLSSRSSTSLWKEVTWSPCHLRRAGWGQEVEPRLPRWQSGSIQLMIRGSWEYGDWRQESSPDKINWWSLHKSYICCLIWTFFVDLNVWFDFRNMWDKIKFVKERKKNYGLHSQSLFHCLSLLPSNYSMNLDSNELLCTHKSIGITKVPNKCNGHR